MKEYYRLAVTLIIAVLMLYFIIRLFGCAPANGASLSASNIDISNVIVSVIALLVGGAITWVFGSIVRIRRDVNAHFRKLRGLYRDVHHEDWEEFWNDRI